MEVWKLSAYISSDRRHILEILNEFLTSLNCEVIYRSIFTIIYTKSKGVLSSVNKGCYNPITVMVSRVNWRDMVESNIQYLQDAVVKIV